MLFSIIIPAFNRAELLTQAIQSVLSQTYSNREILGGSSDLRFPMCVRKIRANRPRSTWASRARVETPFSCLTTTTFFLLGQSRNTPRPSGKARWRIFLWAVSSLQRVKADLAFGHAGRGVCPSARSAPARDQIDGKLLLDQPDLGGAARSTGEGQIIRPAPRL